MAAPEIPGWSLVFEDNFDSGGLDDSNYQEYWGGIGDSCWWNGNDAITVENGMARLKIDKKTVSRDGKTYQYTAGGFNQNTALTYGRWDIRVRMPMEVGNQSYISLWRQDFKWPPEIDFAEATGRRPNDNVFSQHHLKDGKVQWDGYTLTGTDPSVFHEYTLIWEPGKLTWLVDGVKRYTTSQKYADFPMVLALGDFIASCSSASGCADSTTSYPSYMDIDYIRIYKRG